MLEKLIDLLERTTTKEQKLSREIKSVSLTKETPWMQMIEVQKKIATAHTLLEISNELFWIISEAALESPEQGKKFLKLLRAIGS